MEDERCILPISEPVALSKLRHCSEPRCRCQKFIFLFPNLRSRQEMEPFSCVASSVAIVESVARGGLIIRKAASDYRQASKDSQHLQRRRLHHAENITGLDRLPQEIRDKLSVSLQSAADIEAAFPDDLTVSKKRDKCFWVASRKRKAEEGIKKLRQIEGSSSLTITIEAMKEVSELKLKISELSTQISLHDRCCVNYMIEQQKQHESQVKQLLQALPSTPGPNTRITSQRHTYDDNPIAQFLNITCRLAVLRKDPKNTTTTASLHWPLLWAMMLMIHIKFEGLWPRLPRFAIRTRFIIAPDAPIVDACKNGDEFKIQLLFDAGEARPNDFTSDNLVLLQHAIRRQHLGTVKLLLRNNADPNITFGAKETSPLNIAFLLRNPQIIRALLEAGADLEYVNGRTWKTLSYLWDPDPNIASHAATSEILDICAEQEFEGWHHADTIGWAPAHRAAAFGLSSHIRKLRSLGVDMQQLTSPADWAPLHCAARYGNLSTFEVLSAGIHPVLLTEMRDRRGWGMLHLAAASGSKELIAELLSWGFDPDEVTDESSLLLPKELYYRELTPRTIAQHYGFGGAYDEAMKSLGMEPESRRSEKELLVELS